MTVPHPIASSASMAQVSSIGSALSGPATTRRRTLPAQPCGRQRASVRT